MRERKKAPWQLSSRISLPPGKTTFPTFKESRKKKRIKIPALCPDCFYNWNSENWGTTKIRHYLSLHATSTLLQYMQKTVQKGRLLDNNHTPGIKHGSQSNSKWHLNWPCQLNTCLQGKIFRWATVWPGSSFPCSNVKWRRAEEWFYSCAVKSLWTVLQGW